MLAYCRTRVAHQREATTDGTFIRHKFGTIFDSGIKLKHGHRLSVTAINETFDPVLCRAAVIDPSVSKTAAVLALSLAVLCGCKELVPLDTESLIDPRLRRSEIVGFLAGVGTTFAAIPDLIAMFKRRSSAGMSPRMAAITGSFQILWIYYGLLIASRPVIVWNVIAVAINFLVVAAYFHYVRQERIARAARTADAQSRYPEERGPP